MIQQVAQADLPQGLRNIPSPPQQLYVRSEDKNAFADILEKPRVAIVGTRNISTYGQTVTAKLAGDLAAYGIVIVSGLALGVDAVAHRAALEANGLTLAVLPGSVEEIHPRSHVPLAKHLLSKGGVLVSEYPEGTVTFRPNFVARNRIVTGLANTLLITEAADNSGTMHTARFALQQGIDVLVVPGNITSPTSAGTNNLLKAGAAPVTNAKDVLHVLGIQTTSQATARLTRVRGGNADEQQLIDLIEAGVQDGADLLSTSGFTVEQFNHHLTMLEITTKIRPLGANQWALR